MNSSKSRDPRFWRRWANAGAVSFTELDLETGSLHTITRTIAVAIATAKDAHRNFANNAPVQPGSLQSNKLVPVFLVSFDFSKVKVSVCQDSDPTLIYREWQRARSGYTTSKKVGPYPKANLSAKEVDSDRRIQAEKEALWEKESAERQVVHDQEKREFFAELNTCPMMDRDEATWQEAINEAAKYEFSSKVFMYSEYWARLLQKKMIEGYKLEAVAKECSIKACDLFEVSHSTYVYAVLTLARYWKYGKELRVWYNKQYGVGEAIEGIVDSTFI